MDAFSQRRGSTWQWARLRPDDGSFTGWAWWGLAYIAAPVIAVTMLVTGSAGIGDAWSAAHGGGRLGTLHVTSKECGFHRYVGYQCTGLYGDYTSTDGSTTLHHAFLDGIPRGAHVGSAVPVRYLGEHDPTIVYTATGSHEWLFEGLLMLAGLLTLGVWSVNFYARTHAKYLPWMTRPLDEAAP